MSCRWKKDVARGLFQWCKENIKLLKISATKYDAEFMNPFNSGNENGMKTHTHKQNASSRGMNSLEIGMKTILK